MTEMSNLVLVKKEALIVKINIILDIRVASLCNRALTGRLNGSVHKMAQFVQDVYVCCNVGTHFRDSTDG